MSAWTDLDYAYVPYLAAYLTVVSVMGARLEIDLTLQIAARALGSMKCICIELCCLGRALEMCRIKAQNVGTAINGSQPRKLLHWL